MKFNNVPESYWLTRFLNLLAPILPASIHGDAMLSRAQIVGSLSDRINIQLHERSVLLSSSSFSIDVANVLSSYSLYIFRTFFLSLL